MNDLYQTLGVDPGASQDEIKSAYRKLAMKHHPDRMGGDDTKFKEIQNAYGILGDAQKKAEYDHQRQYGGGPQVRFHTEGFQDIADIFGGRGPFGSHPFADIFGRQIRRNRDLNIQCQITLVDSYNGKQLEASYKLPSGKHQTVVINVPAGIEHGSTIKYGGLGDDSVPNMPRGDLNVTIIVMPDARYERRGADLYTNLEVTPIEAMIGCKKIITTLGGSKLPVDVRPGVETGVEYASNGHGFPSVNSDYRGKFIAVIKIVPIPVTDPTLVQRLSQINAELGF
jgi:curved DNA-binding protein